MWAVTEASQLKIEAEGGDGKKKAANLATPPVPTSQHVNIYSSKTTVWFTPLRGGATISYHIGFPIYDYLTLW